MSDRPAKPYPEFPLFAHASGRWCKKIRGRNHYFGKWEIGWQAALAAYQEVADYLHSGRRPPTDPNAVTVRYVCNHFLTAKEKLCESGDITQRTFDDYRRTAVRVADELGKDIAVASLTVTDFDNLRKSLSKTMGPVTLGNEITRVRVLFKHAYDCELIDRPVRFGPHFKKPSKKTLRTERAKKGKRLFTAQQLCTLVDEASEQMAAMIHLGVNCGFGNMDCARLTRKHLNGTNWLDYPRHKTGIPRRCYLWDETLQSLAFKRPSAKDEKHDSLVFITKYGQPWFKESVDSPITKEFRKLLDDTGIYRPGLSFYALRHTFETVAGESRDQAAVDHIMGHARDDMASLYREEISDERLVDVSLSVRRWMYGQDKVVGFGGVKTGVSTKKRPKRK